MSTPRPVTRDDYPDNFGTWKASVEKRLSKLFTRAASAAAATVGTAGSFVVRGLLDLTGSVSMKSEDGNELLRMGDVGFGRGIEMKRDDGTTALRFGKPFAGVVEQQWELLDRNGKAVVSEELLGPGLGRPCLQLPFQPIYPTSGTPVVAGPYGIERSTTSGTFETLFVYDGRAQNLLLDFKFLAMCSDGTTEGEIQVVDLDTGLPRPGFLVSPWLGVVPAGTTSMSPFDPTSTQILSTVAVVGMGGQMRLAVQARRTAGAGSITLAVAQAMGG